MILTKQHTFRYESLQDTLSLFETNLFWINNILSNNRASLEKLQPLLSNLFFAVNDATDKSLMVNDLGFENLLRVYP